MVNHAISALRRAPRFDAVELEEHHACADSDSSRIELGLDLAEALAQLDSEDRAVVWLYDVEGYSHAEIADFFGLTESFSKTRLSRARVRLRELIHPSMDPRDPDLTAGPAPLQSGEAPAGTSKTDDAPKSDDRHYSSLPSGPPAGGC